MDISKIKNISPNRTLIKKIISLAVSIIVMVCSYLIINNASKSAKDTVAVLRVKSKNGLQAYETITEDKIEKYNLVRKEYTEDMILAKDEKKVLNKLSKYYIRKNSILYKDQIVDEKPIRNEWLYELDEDYEVITIPFNYNECGGDILMPGDRIRVRITYEDEENVAPRTSLDFDDFNPNLSSNKTTGKKLKTDILFDSIVITDMLNESSQSIYEIYKEVMRLNEDKKQEVLKSESFRKSVRPRALLLTGTKEQISNYAEYLGKNTKSMLITILSRANSDVILDQLPVIEMGADSWTEKEED